MFGCNWENRVCVQENQQIPQSCNAYKIQKRVSTCDAGQIVGLQPLELESVGNTIFTLTSLQADGIRYT